MAIILSISEANGKVWAAGPNGLFLLRPEGLVPVPQPMERLSCVLALPEWLLVGGGPHGVAYAADPNEQWQAAWREASDAPVLAMIADSVVNKSATLVAGTEGGGILRSTDRGRSWTPCNFGLRSDTVLSLAWAPMMRRQDWPHRELVFSGTEEGLYYSPNAGRGWKRMQCDEAAYQTITMSSKFAEDRLVLAGTEQHGIWRSADGGRTFHHVDDGPQQINALTAWNKGWLLSDSEQLWRSKDGRRWKPVPESEPALVFRFTSIGLLAGTAEGVSLLTPGTLSVQRRFTYEPEKVS